ncbi:unnamed protein product [Amoebophrya sp. A120]|nr:unnamed protein product [Amoebophrya sp. A120]|eukprot:GSA120T00011089001.1
MVNHMIRVEADRAGIEAKYTHFGILWNNITAPHTDGKNSGSSQLIAGGDFSGGRFVKYNPSGTIKGVAPKEITWKDVETFTTESRTVEKGEIYGEPVEVRHRMIQESGLPPHWTEDFTGERKLCVSWVDKCARIEEGSEWEQELSALEFKNFDTVPPRETKADEGDEEGNDGAVVQKKRATLKRRALDSLKPMKKAKAAPKLKAKGKAPAQADAGLFEDVGDDAENGGGGGGGNVDLFDEEDSGLD